jgi:hypothetical protein
MLLWGGDATEEKEQEQHARVASSKIRMPPDSISEQRRFMSLFLLIEMQNQYVALLLHSGLRSFGRLAWTMPDSDGCHGMTGVYWIPIMQILEDRGPQVYLVNARYARMFLAGEPMYRIANRFSNSTLLGCWKPPSDRHMRYAQSGRLCVTSTTWLNSQRAMGSICKKLSTRWTFSYITSSVMWQV